MNLARFLGAISEKLVLLQDFLVSSWFRISYEQYRMTDQQAVAQAFQSVSSDQPQIPTSTPDSSIPLAQSGTSGIPTIEHSSQHPLNADIRGDDDDGYNWRKYGQKQVKGSEFTRSYYKCTKQGCPARKKVERSLDGQVSRIVYSCQHNHDSLHSRRWSPVSAVSQFQTSSPNKTKREQHEAASLAMSEESNSEEVGARKISVREEYEDEPDSKRTRIVQRKSEVDIIDDRYKWRKYGQKAVKGSLYPRSYYKCTTQGCAAKKQVKRTGTDPKDVVTTYEGRHNHDLPPANTTVLPSFGKVPIDKLKSEAYENLRYASLGVGGPLWDTTVDGALWNPPDDELSIGAFSNTTVDGALSNTTEGCDVVISYERSDITNDDFISHLSAALCRRGISVDEEIDLVDTVSECRVLILLLTSTYVPSNLLSILAHNQTKYRVVYPIFYRLSPSDFIINSKNYERYFLQDEPKRWQAALKEIVQMPGYTLTDKSESKLIDEIVRDALKVLSSGDKVNMIGMDIQVEEILSLLCVESIDDVRSIGIWGTVGIGKTAIAEEIFRRISVQYETCVFLKDLHKEVELKGNNAVREDILSKLIEVEPHVIRISDMKTSFLSSRLQHKRVLVILDNVNDYRDVETFLGMLNYLGPGSRIIITSRNKHVFVLCKLDRVYEVKPLDIPKSLQLLDRGLKSVSSPEVYRTFSLEMVKFSYGNPQVLHFLRDIEWKGLSQRIQKTSPIYIRGIFETCCSGLDDNERSIFLDIACFFNRMDKDNVAVLLDGHSFSAHVGLRTLVDKSLLTISQHNTVNMLSFIQATGREIIRLESPWPEYCSRLWNPEFIVDVIIHDKGTSAIEGIFLDTSKLKFDSNPNVFEKMSNLRLLKFYCSEVIENRGVSLPQGLKYLPSKLRLLHWEYYPLSFLPKKFNPENLVELNLSSSCVKKLWKGKKCLEKLRKMRLSFSNQLTKIPRLSSATNLEHIDLEGCNSLVSISQSISYLKKLVFLNLKDCSKLESVPSMIDLESLEILNLSGCSKLENFPEISPNVKELYMGGTMIQEIPSSIKNLVLLEKLDLENSEHLKNLPTSICKLKRLETLNLSGCTSLTQFPDLSRRMKCLRLLDLSRTAIKELPSSSISYLTALEEVRFVESRNLVRLPDNAWSLRFKVEFRQIDTEKFSRLWNRMGWLKKVQKS